MKFIIMPKDEAKVKCVYCASTSFSIDPVVRFHEGHVTMEITCLGCCERQFVACPPPDIFTDDGPEAG